MSTPKKVASSGISSQIITWQKTSYQLHRNRVKSANATVDMKTPKARPHIHHNAKKLQLQKERETEIIKNNFILMRNLEEIMRGKKNKENYPLKNKRSR